MRSSVSRATAFLGAAFFALAAALVLDRRAPFPGADVSRGSEEAFTEGLQPREFDAAALPRRWTGRRAHLRFRNLPPGPLTLQVFIRGHRSPVAVAAEGVVAGVIAPEQTSGEFALSGARGGRLEVILSTEAFLAEDGRRLGMLLDRVSVLHGRPSLPSWALAGILVVPALATVAAAAGSGFAPASATLLAWFLTLVQCLALWPCGLLRSSYAPALAFLLTLGAGLAFGFARLQRARVPGAAPWAFAALTAAFWVQVVGATHPLMVVGDAQFHVHKLYDVSRGDFWPTSVTQHARPFRFPYGVSFYALLAPLVRARIDAVAIVRGGAAAAGLLASAALFWLIAPLSARRAAVAVLLLQLLPITFDVYSYGNLSNVFGQAMTALFFAWWTGRREASWSGGLAGAVILALGCLGHLSSLIVLVALSGALLMAGGVGALRRDRGRLLALGLGLGAALLYYLQFWELLAGQGPRVLEGGGQGRGASRGTLDAVRLQVLGALEQWGLPAIVLAAVGRPRRGAPLDRDLAAYWAAGAALALLAMFTPVDVRYLYALTLPLAVASATGLLMLWDKGGRGPLLALLLLLAQSVWTGRRVLEAILYRYRPPW